MSLSLVAGAVVVLLAFAAIIVLSACVLGARADANLADLNDLNE